MNETRERWQRAKTIFQAALERAETERAAFVENECGDDKALTARVAALLAADAETSTPLESPAVTLAARVLGDKNLDSTDQQLDRYRLLREIGRGGMGMVYLAERDDGAYKANVAVKVIQRGMVHESLVRRFHQERQILAHLEHPNIARLLDGGVTEDGRPYLVMEYVEGLPLDRYCEDHRLGIADRIDLFRTVCQGVHAAHRNLVVHCDLKPSNILVTTDGVPKLLDFGIARLLDSEEADRPSPQTVGSGLMTPEYASPEQIRGEALTTASDVYGLGVVLYRLLTGSSPYRVETDARHALEQAVLDQQPTVPSLVWDRRSAGDNDGKSPWYIGTPARHRKQLAGDLDTIVLKALEKNTSRRYGSAAELAADLHRHRTGLPVLARRPTARYRAGKFLHRHWLGVGAATLIVLSMAVGSVATTYQARIARQRAHEADQQAAIARQRERDAEQTLRFVVELFESTHPDNANKRSLIEVLDEADLKMESALSDQPLARARLMDTLGEVYRQLAVFDRAEPLLVDALTLRREGLPAGHPDIADSLDELGALRTDQRHYEKARALLDEAHTLRLGHFGPGHIDVALSEHRLGQLARRERHFEAALRHFERALTIRRRHLGRHPKVAETLNNLGVVLTDVERYEEAEAVLEESLALRKELFGEHHWRTGNTFTNLGTALRESGRNEEATASHAKALDILRATLGEHPRVAAALNNLAVALEKLGRLGEAKSSWEEAKVIMEATDNKEAPGYALIQANLARLRRQ